MGSVLYSGVAADTTAGDLPAGRYCLGTRSTVPWVTIQAGSDAHVITWGDVVDVPEGTKASVKNTSLHAGDIWLNTCAIASKAPPSLTIPANFELLQFSLPPVANWFTSRWIDLRGARRVYLALNKLNAGNISFFIQQKALRKDGLGPNTAGASGTWTGPGGDVVFEQPTAGFPNFLPLGIGSGLILKDAGGERVADNAPMALLDTGRVFVGNLDANALGWTNGAGKYVDAFFVLEYL